jgi:hypothetical protein
VSDSANINNKCGLLDLLMSIQLNERETERRKERDGVRGSSVSKRDIDVIS